MMTKRYVITGVTMFSMLFAGACISASSIPSAVAQNFVETAQNNSTLPTTANANASSSDGRSQQMAYAIGYDAGSSIRTRQEDLSSRTAQKLIVIENVRQAIRDAWNDKPLRYNDLQMDRAKKEVDQLLAKSGASTLGSDPAISSNLAVCYSYALGVELAYSARLMRDQLDLEQLLLGLDQGFIQVSARLDPTTRSALLGVIREQLDAKRIQMNAGNWQKSIAFMIGNSKRPGVKTLRSGLQYEVIKAGHGSSPGSTDRVTVAYTGTLIDGQVFDDSRSRGIPVTFPLNNVVLGFTEGLRLMTVGGRFKLYIPPELGYGDRGAGTKIEPNQALIFDVELLDIRHSEDAINLAAYRDASARFLDMVSAAEQHNAPSELQGGEATQLVSILSDEGRFLKARAYGTQDINDLSDLCVMSNKVIVKLARFNPKAHDDASAAQTEARGKVVALINTNLQTFGEQLKQLHPFLMRCMATEIPPMTHFAQSLSSAQFNDERRGALEQLGVGIAGLFAGALRGIGDTSMVQEYRRAMVSTLAEVAPGFVSVLQVSARKKLRDLTESTELTSPSTFVPFLKRIHEALDDSVCKDLCAIQRQIEATAIGSGVNKPGAISWANQVATKIRSNWSTPIDRPAAFECRIKVNLLPNGSVVSVKIIQSCGEYALDASLEKAVYRSDPFPVPDNPNDFDPNLILRFSP